MPIICFKKRLKLNNYDDILSFAFNCIYDKNYHLKLKDYKPNYFDCGDFRIKIEQTLNKLDNDLLKEYLHKNKEVLYISLLNYFYDNIPELYSIKFESEDGDSIYYVKELLNIKNKID